MATKKTEPESEDKQVDEAPEPEPQPEVAEAVDPANETFCPKGHELTSRNLVVMDGVRLCRTCALVRRTNATEDRTDT